MIEPEEMQQVLNDEALASQKTLVAKVTGLAQFVVTKRKLNIFSDLNRCFICNGRAEFGDIVVAREKHKGMPWAHLTCVHTLASCTPITSADVRMGSINAQLIAQERDRIMETGAFYG